MSQCDQLAALLSDGRWWTTRELLREVPCIVHSRVSDLRKRGLIIEHETVGPGAAGSRYRLVEISVEPVRVDWPPQAIDAQAGDDDNRPPCLGTENVPSTLTAPARLSSPSAGPGPLLQLTLDAA
jgi:hypothetical protein